MHGFPHLLGSHSLGWPRTLTSYLRLTLNLGCSGFYLPSAGITGVHGGCGAWTLVIDAGKHSPNRATSPAPVPGTEKHLEQNGAKYCGCFCLLDITTRNIFMCISMDLFSGTLV